MYTFLDIHLNKKKNANQIFKIIINEIKLIRYYLIVWTFERYELVAKKTLF